MGTLRTLRGLKNSDLRIRLRRLYLDSMYRLNLKPSRETWRLYAYTFADATDTVNGQELGLEAAMIAYELGEGATIEESLGL